MEPIQTLTVPQAVVRRITRMIYDGVWSPGERLPSQRQLAREFDVGMSSLREALQTLRGMGVLELRHGHGTFVCRNPGRIVERCLNLALMLNRDMVEDFLDARRAVEGGLAYLAAKRASEEQIMRLQDLAQSMMAPIENGGAGDTRFEELDLAFHRLVAEMSESNLLHYLSDTLFETLEEFLSVVPHTQRGVRRHAAVCEAIAERDPERSQQAMHDLVDATADYLHFFEDNGGVPPETDAASSQVDGVDVVGGEG
jgi:GntR family transcriptional repressor for pyruvate dehydrogenase complex